MLFRSTAVAAFTVLQNGKVQSESGTPDCWNMIKKAGKWYMQGDLRIANVNIESWAQYSASNTSAQIQTGLNLNIEDRGGKGITSAVVTGKGLTSPVTLVNQINNSWFVIQTATGNSGSIYTMNDSQINAIADTGEVYTVQLYIGSTPMAPYTVKLKKRPYLNTELSISKFPIISSPTVSQLRAFNGGTFTLSWSLPAGLTSNWADININDYAGNSARSEYSLQPTDTTKSMTVDAKTSTGQTFVPTNRYIWLSANDSFGRQLSTSLY